MRDPRAVRERSFDLLVVGGGAIGAGAARDAALRGLRVALVEQDDFSSGTTSRSTRLIHGGLRYLQHREFGLVRENLRERKILLRLAPHLVFPLPVHVPLYRPSAYQRLRLRAGMLLYDLLSFGKRLPRRAWLPAEELLALEPTIERDGLRGAWRFYDAHAPLVERLVVENIVDAIGHGTAVLNHASVERWLREQGRVVGAVLRDRIGGGTVEVRARWTVNATGAWLDRTTGALRREGPPLLRLTKGIHLVTAPGTRLAHLLFAPSDGRPFFVIPWLGGSFVGTTDTDFAGDPGEVRADPEDIEYLVASAKHSFPSAPFDDVRYTIAGVRALVRVEGVEEGAVPREHTILDHERSDGIGGIVSIVGGKLTAYRSIAAEAVDLVARRLGKGSPCTTDRRPFPGAVSDLADLARGISPAARALGLADDQLERLVRVYGARATTLLARIEDDRRLATRLAPTSAVTRVEVSATVAEEHAATLADFMLRRSCAGLESDRGLAVASAAADALAEELGWSTSRREEELEAYRALAGARVGVEAVS